MNLIQGASTGTGTEEDEDDDYNITEDQRQAMLALQGFGKISNPFNGIRLPQDLQVHGHDDEDDDDDEEYEVEPLPYDIEERLREVNAAFQADQTPLESERPRRVGFRSNLVTVFNSSTESLSASTEEGSEEVPELQPVEDTNAAWILKEPEKEVEGLPKPLKPTEDLLEPLKPILPKPPLTDQQWLRQHLTRKGILNMDNDYDGLNGLIKPQTPGNLSNNTDQCIVSPVPSDGEVGSSDSSSTIPTDSGGASSSSNSDRVLETDASGCERALVERDGKFQWVEVENLTLTERRKVGLDTGRPPSARPKLKDIGKTPSKESPSRDIQIPVPNRAEKAKPGRRPQSPTKLTRRKSKSPPLVSPPPAKTPPKTTTKTSTSTTTRSGPSLRPRTAGPPLEQPLLRHHKSQSLINLDRPRPSTAGNVKQPMAWQWAKLPKYEGMNSPYGLTAEQLKEKERQGDESRQRRRKESQAKEEVEQEKKKQREQEFKAWLESVRKREKARRGQHSDPNTKKGPMKARDNQAAELSFQAWLEKKKLEEKAAKRREEIIKSNENGRRHHSQEECEHAFSAWIKRKNAERKEVAAQQAVHRTMSLDRLLKHTRTLHSAYMAYFGSAF